MNFTPEDASRTVREMLENPAYRTAARRVQEEFNALPGPEAVVAALEALV